MSSLKSERVKRVKFAEHAHGKFALLRKYGFEIDESTVRCVIENPSRLDSRGNQLLALKPMDQEHAVRVVYEKVNDNIVVITFYPVKRVRFHV